MNVGDISKIIKAKTGCSLVDARETWNAVRGALLAELFEKDQVRVPDLVRMKLKLREKFVAHNPKTKESIGVPAKCVVRATPCKNVKEYAASMSVKDMRKRLAGKEK